MLFKVSSVNGQIVPCDFDDGRFANVNVNESKDARISPEVLFSNVAMKTFHYYSSDWVSFKA